MAVVGVHCGHPLRLSGSFLWLSTFTTQDCFKLNTLSGASGWRWWAFTVGILCASASQREFLMAQDDFTGCNSIRLIASCAMGKVTKIVLAELNSVMGY